MEKKLRHSHQRDRIYQYLCQSTLHPSAETVYQDLKPEIPGLSLGTVYRNLKLLEELGKIRKVTSLQGTDRYDALCTDHAHFICQRCGALQDLDDIGSLKIRDTLPLDEGYRILKFDLTITGFCPNCTD